jgi:hypothetical protein
MVRRKGEMSTFQIDNGWPFQVALPEAVSLGKANDVVRDFCALAAEPRNEFLSVDFFSKAPDIDPFVIAPKRMAARTER